MHKYHGNGPIKTKKHQLRGNWNFDISSTSLLQTYIPRLKPLETQQFTAITSVNIFIASSRNVFCIYYNACPGRAGRPIWALVKSQKTRSLIATARL